MFTLVLGRGCGPRDQRNGGKWESQFINQWGLGPQSQGIGGKWESQLITLSTVPLHTFRRDCVYLNYYT